MGFVYRLWELLGVPGLGFEGVHLRALNNQGSGVKGNYRWGFWGFFRASTRYIDLPSSSYNGNYPPVQVLEGELETSHAISCKGTGIFKHIAKRSSFCR